MSSQTVQEVVFIGGRGSSVTYYGGGARVAKGVVANMNACPAVQGFTSITAQYLLDQSGEQVTELDGSGNWQHTNFFAAGRLLATYDTRGQHFHFTDWLGTRRAQTTAAGVSEEQCQSLPFGDGLNCSGSGVDATEHHFTGKERDTESGNDFFLARYYNSTTGRFLTPDWSLKAEPVPYARLDIPQTLNLYAYVGNNPLTHTDVDGHLAISPEEPAAICGYPGDPCMTLAAQLTQDMAEKDKERAAAQQQKKPKPKAQQKKALPKVVVAADPPGPTTVGGLYMGREVRYRAHKVNTDGTLGDPIDGGPIGLRETVLKATPGTNPHPCTPSCPEEWPSFTDSQGANNGQFLDVRRVWTYNGRPVDVWDPVQKSPASAEILHEEYGNDPNRYFMMTYEHQ
ncbi:MAG: RHS repeat-associated core domain-containing protein [Terracidiphilus sp.]